VGAVASRPRRCVCGSTQSPTRGSRRWLLRLVSAAPTEGSIDPSVGATERWNPVSSKLSGMTSELQWGLPALWLASASVTVPAARAPAASVCRATLRLRSACAASCAGCRGGVRGVLCGRGGPSQRAALRHGGLQVGSERGERVGARGRRHYRMLRKRRSLGGVGWGGGDRSSLCPEGVTGTEWQHTADEWRTERRVGWSNRYKPMGAVLCPVRTGACHVVQFEVRECLSAKCGDAPCSFCRWSAASQAKGTAHATRLNALQVDGAARSAGVGPAGPATRAAAACVQQASRDGMQANVRAGHRLACC
jgi:hypothetical protein